MDASDGWSGLARQLTSGSNVTCNQFDIPFASMRDLAFVLSTKDNSRRIAEEPKRRERGFGAHDAFSPDVYISQENDAPRPVTGRPLTAHRQCIFSGHALALVAVIIVLVAALTTCAWRWEQGGA